MAARVSRFLVCLGVLPDDTPPVTSIGDRAFITFRYAADAKRAVAAFQPRSLVSGLWSAPPSWYHRSLKVCRAPEADDLIWEHLVHGGSRHYSVSHIANHTDHA